MISVADALKHLHDAGITHEALAAKNLLLDTGLQVKIGSLGRRNGNCAINTQELMLRGEQIYDSDVCQWMV